MVLDKKVSPKEYFFLHDGTYLHTLQGLADVLPRLSSSIFEYHTRHGNNDYADWIDHVFQEPALAARVRLCHSAHEMSQCIKEALSSPRKEPAAKEPVSSIDTVSTATAASAVATVAVAATNAAQAIRTDSSSSSSSRSSSDEFSHSHSSFEQEITMKKEALADTTKETAAIWDDERFAPIKRDMAMNNEKLTEKYDEIIKRLQNVTLDPLPKEYEQTIEKLNGRYNDLLLKISEHRRSGKDMLFPSLIAKQFQAKLTLAKATRQQVDFAIASQVLDQVEYAIHEVLDAKELNIKEEVERMAAVKL